MENNVTLTIPPIEKSSKVLSTVKDALQILAYIVLGAIAWGKSTSTTTNNTSDILSVKNEIHDIRDAVNSLNIDMAYIKGKLSEKNK